MSKYTVIIDIRSYYLNFVVEPLWGFEAPNSHCLFLTKVFSIGSRGGWGKLDEGLHNVKVCNIPKYLANFVRSHSTSGCPYFSKLFQSFLYISSWVSVLYTYIYICNMVQNHWKSLPQWLILTHGWPLQGTKIQSFCRCLSTDLRHMMGLGTLNSWKVLDKIIHLR